MSGSDDRGGAPAVLVTGGVGGHHARTEDLARATRSLRAAADSLFAADMAVRQALWQISAGVDNGPRAVEAAADPLAAARLRHLVMEVDAPGVGITATRAECERIAEAMAETARRLERAERDAEAHLGLVGRARWELGALLSTVVSVTDYVSPAWVTSLMPVDYSPFVDAIAGSPVSDSPVVTTQILDAEAVQNRIAALDVIGLGFGLENAAAALAMSLVMLDEIFGTLGDVVVTAGPPVSAAPPVDLARVVESLGDLSPLDGGESHTIAITEVVAPDGTSSWVVELPGTQDWIPDGGDNPMDATGNAQLIAGQTTTYMAAVSKAMEEAGIGPDEQVMMVGHSQGGIVAMALMAQPAFASRYSVSTVVTAGSPVASMAPPGGGTAVHLENRTDIVPSLDGKVSPDSADRITVSRDPRAAPAPGDGAAGTNILDAHKPDAYVGTAAGFDASDSPSALQWREDNSAFFDQDATATRVEYRVERET